MAEAKQQVDMPLKHIADLLAGEAADLASHERMASASRRRRDTLAMKLLTSGLWSERAVARLCGISGSAVHQLKARYVKEVDRV